MERIVIPPSCEVRIGAGLAPDLPEREDRRRIALLAQPPVAALARRLARHWRTEGMSAEVRVVPDGDAAKTLVVAGDVYAWLNELELTRHDTVVGVGGGAVTDLAGFVAATYLRGVEAVYHPTTLLGAVDAAVGGKTGVNVGGKNLVGAFRHPAAIYIDTEVLAGLPPALLREGAAEALKAGLIADPELVDLYEHDGLQADVAEVVRRAVAVKADIVAADFTEQAGRAVLNYGHTVGHAIETAGGVSHGHAVAVGMVAAGAVAERRLDFEWADRQREILAGLGLPVRATAVERAAVLRLLRLDKKRDASGLRMVLLRDIAEPVLVPVDQDDVDRALAAIGL